MTATLKYLATAALVVGTLGRPSCLGGKKNGPSPNVKSTSGPQYWTPPDRSGNGGNGSVAAPNVLPTSSSTFDSLPVPPESLTPRTDHPRLLVRAADLPRLRSWAVPDNPIFASGIEALAKSCAQRMDAGELAKDNGLNYTTAPTEGFMEVFAFMSLIHPSESARADYAKRAHKLLMTIMNEAVKGQSEGKPWRAKSYPVDDRSRYMGDAFGYTVDWIYPLLSAADKATIRKVLLRWSDELVHSAVTSNDHPEPIGVVNDPKLTENLERVRWSANNYFTGHMRNLGLFSLALDAGDDPDGKLRGYLKVATGAYLYMFDALAKTDMAGGLGAEGFEYSPQSLGYVAQFLLSLHTSGNADPKAHGPQATFQTAFWNAALPAYVHSLSPTSGEPKDKDLSYKAPIFTVAWYGDGQKFLADDPMALFGPLGVYDEITKNDKRLAVIRWIERNVPPTGPAGLDRRARDDNSMLEPMFYFLLFDPKTNTSGTDPRKDLPLSHVAPGIGRVLARTSWEPNATWFTFKLGWNAIDHQHGDGNMFELYRKGEWLIKERTGYGSQVGSSDHKNTITVLNNKPIHDDGGYRSVNYKAGSQWMYVSDGPGRILAASVSLPKFVYVLGDATMLYNSSYEASQDVAHASRSIVWLEPDRVITYDRVASKSDGRFKRYNLNLGGSASAEGNLVTMSTLTQKLFVRAVLPSPATIAVTKADDVNNEVAHNDPTVARLKIEAPGNPKSTRFLNVIQAGDRAATPDSVALVKSTAGTPYEGVVDNDVALLFPVDLGKVDKITFAVPSATKATLVTGLEANGAYKVTTQPSGANTTITVEAGGDKKADSGGVLVIGAL